MELLTQKVQKFSFSDINIDKKPGPNKKELFGGFIKSEKIDSVILIAYIYKTKKAATSHAKKMINQINKGVKRKFLNI